MNVFKHRAKLVELHHLVPTTVVRMACFTTPRSSVVTRKDILVPPEIPFQGLSLCPHLAFIKGNFEEGPPFYKTSGSSGVPPWA